MNWQTIKSIMDMKVVSSAGVWVFVVPALVKTSIFFSDSESGLGVSGINIELASLSLLTLYFSAVSFFLGGLFYYLSCPSLLKVVDTFSDFCEQKFSEYRLSEELEGLSEKNANKLVALLRSGAAEASADKINSCEFILLNVGKSNSINLEDDQLSNAFWIIQSYLSRSKLVMRMTCSLFFIVGFCLLASIFVRNISLVIIYSIKIN